MTDEATRALWQEQGWRLVVHTPEYEDWRLLSDPQDTGITIVHWGPPMLTGNSALILKALACGVKVPGYAVVRDEEAAEAAEWKSRAQYLEKILDLSGIRKTHTFAEWMAKYATEPLEFEVIALVNELLAPKEGT